MYGGKKLTNMDETLADYGVDGEDVELSVHLNGGCWESCGGCGCGEACGCTIL